MEGVLKALLSFRQTHPHMFNIYLGHVGTAGDQVSQAGPAFPKP